MPLKEGKFPYTVVGSYPTALAAYQAGWIASQTWAVFVADGMIGYAPPHLTEGVSHYAVTNEHHDCGSYYEQEID